ncbi:MAG: hypothetical protein K8L91_09275 [Anaerolineae bacterium]|nr:hypothetical protein [Anaerolineae bacterium]
MMEQVAASELERTEETSFDFAAWSQEVEALREQMPRIDGVGLLRDIRDGVE